MKRIEKITIEHIDDNNSPTSWMGEYSDTPKDYSIIVYGDHAGEFVADVPDDELPERCREYRYFNAPVENYEGEKDEDIRKYALQDFKEMQAFFRGEWGFIGIRAKA